MTESSPHLARRLGHRLTLAFRRLHGRIALSVGAAARTRPLCPNFGLSRGTPIDRYYIDTFLATNATDIRGHVLEVGDDAYSRRFGAGRITRQDVLHLHGSDLATIAGDLTKPGLLPSAAFDCIILTQTLHHIFDLQAAIEQIFQALKPGGRLLVTAPGIAPIEGEWKDISQWSFTALSVEHLLCGPFNRAKVEVAALGNLFAATSFLQGACVEEVSTRKLDLFDPAYPVIITARAIR
jgi:SAM-dependent methyltransferase